MENVATDDNWKNCFSQMAPGLVLFARQWTRSPADAEDIVQEAFVRFWRKQDKIGNPEKIGAREGFRSRGLLYAMVRSIALDFLRRDSRRARRESLVVAESDSSVQPEFAVENESQQELAAAIALLPNEQ